MEINSIENKGIEFSILKGDRLFNKNTPFVINIIAQESKKEETRINADLICIIDTSGSMLGDKIHQVRESLKILVDMMNEKDRIALILFDRKANLYFELNYLTEKNKSILKFLIDQIDAHGGTNIFSGLEIAIEILKKEKLNDIDVGRSSSVILLSDGRDNFYNDIQLGEILKSLTKGHNLFFTLNTFGYGYDHDPKIMNRLANLRDGSFFLVEDYNRVGEYFVSVLGGCISTVSKNAELQVNLLNTNCRIMKIFGANNLYSYELNTNFFKNKMLQFISGKEYTTVLEILIDKSNVKPGDILLDINFIYEDIITKKLKKINTKYIYQIKDLQFSKANEEYIRCQTYDTIEKALKLREQNKFDEGKKILKEMKDWLEKNYKGFDKTYLEDIKKSEQMFVNNLLARESIANTFSLVSQNISKRIGASLRYSNFQQSNLQSNYRINLAQSQKINFNKFKKKMYKLCIKY